MIRFGLVVALATALLFGPGDAGSLKAQDKGTVGKQTSKSQKEAGVPDFAKALGASFDSVQSLSLRLLDARRKGDPIALALVATELDLAEQVANKKAEVTAADIRKEAIDLIKLRARATELKAMSLLLKDEELTKLAQETLEHETKRIADAKLSGVTTRGVHYLEVTNRTATWAHIHIDGQHVGSVAPFANQTFHVPQHWHDRPLRLAARDNQGLEWRATIVTGRHERWHWILEP